MQRFMSVDCFIPAIIVARHSTLGTNSIHTGMLSIKIKLKNIENSSDGNSAEQQSFLHLKIVL